MLTTTDNSNNNGMTRLREWNRQQWDNGDCCCEQWLAGWIMEMGMKMTEKGHTTHTQPHDSWATACEWNGDNNNNEQRMIWRDNDTTRQWQWDDNDNRMKTQWDNNTMGQQHRMSRLNKWPDWGLNPGPTGHIPDALPTELSGLIHSWY